MGLGVLEDRHLDHVPGTALLTDVVGAEQQGGLNTSLLKHAKGRDSDVMLVPQPSRSPSDPLNWSLWKKDLMLFFICIDTAIVGAWVSRPTATIGARVLCVDCRTQGPMISPGYAQMFLDWNMVSFARLTRSRDRSHTRDLNLKHQLLIC